MLDPTRRLMIDKGRRDVILIYSDIELVRAGPSIKGAGKTPQVF